MDVDAPTAAGGGFKAEANGHAGAEAAAEGASYEVRRWRGPARANDDALLLRLGAC